MNKMKGIVGFLFKDKHRIPTMSLAEIIFTQTAIVVVSIILFSVIW